jgi:putative ABC transport system permease protein
MKHLRWLWRLGGVLDIDTWQEIWESLQRNRLRAVLTALGVSWGIFMLVLLLGLGRGLETGTRRTIAGFAPNAVYIWSQRTTMPYAGLQPGRHLLFRNSDIELLEGVPGVEEVAPRIRLGGWRQDGQIVYRSKKVSVNVLGDAPALAAIERFQSDRGRYLNARDVVERRKVVVLGRKARVAVFGEEPAVGRTVQVNGVFFRVVGEISSDKGGEEADRLENAAYVPYTTFQRVFNQPDSIGWFAIGLARDVGPHAVDEAARSALGKRHKVHPDDRQALGSFNAAEKFGEIQGLFRGIQVFVWFVGTLTLFAGALGVSNILLISVKERTKEIGIRKALGATPAGIVGLVVQEAVALTALSGYAGLVLGVTALEVISQLVRSFPEAPIQEPEIDLSAALWAVLALLVTGVLAAIVPARSAAKVAPVEALRAE